MIFVVNESKLNVPGCPNADLKNLRNQSEVIMPAAPKANPPIRTLLGPGPSPVSPRVLAALALPVVGHLDPKFLEIMDQSMAMLRELFQTKNRLALPMSGTGSAGMEICFVNLIEPGERVVIGVNGVFGTRMVRRRATLRRASRQGRGAVGHSARRPESQRSVGEKQTQTGRRRACRDFYRRAPADGRYRQAGARQRRAVRARYRDFVGRRPVRIDELGRSTPSTAARKNV